MISKFVRFEDTTIILYSFFFIIFYFSGGANKNMIYKYFYIATALTGSNSISNQNSIFP